MSPLEIALVDALLVRIESDASCARRLGIAIGRFASGTVPEPSVYTTRGGVLPPVHVGSAERQTNRWTRETAPQIEEWRQEHAPDLPRVERSGPRFGPTVTWAIPRITYEAWLLRHVRAPVPQEAHDVDAWIARSGYRATRKARR